ncbi:MAG: hypothetical protein CEE43_06105 [Promethearchaeota archaeon Loki_b32]|nr:MAG: hypothetical protein CEE43_06105 [Candidatus Lokiarchaeota archaeon Loki_b32]
MEHNKLSLEYDRNLINSILNNINTKYTILYLYIIRKDLFNNLDEDLIDRYERVIILDDIYKNNVELLWDQEFIEKIIDLGLFKNIRSRAEYDQKDGDFILKMGEYTITIEKSTIITPKNTLYNMISKRFKLIPQKDFELGLTKLKEVRCESTSAIHRFIYEVGDNEYVLSNDLYDLLDQFGNIYQAIKIEPTSDGLLQICKEIQDRIVNIVMIFNPILNNDQIIKKLTKALEINKKGKKIEIIEISIKIKLLEKNITLTLSDSDFQILANYKDEMEVINKQLLEIKSNYSGNQEYLGFLEKIPMEIEMIQETLIKIRDNASGAKKAILDLENRIKAKPSDDFDIVHEKIEVKYQDIDADSTIDDLIQHCKEIKDKAVNFIRIFNPIMSNKPVISKIKKTLERNEDIIKDIRNKTLEIAEIFLKLKVSEKIIRLRLSNADFQILSNYKDELERSYKQLLEIQSDSSESDISQQILDEIRENIKGARNSVTEIEKRMIQITKNNKE